MRLDKKVKADWQSEQGNPCGAFGSGGVLIVCGVVMWRDGHPGGLGPLCTSSDRIDGVHREDAKAWENNESVGASCHFGLAEAVLKGRPCADIDCE